MEKNLNLKSENGKSGISTVVSDAITGLWIHNEHGQVGIVAQKGMPPYICFYGNLNGLPALAISANENNKDTTIQIHGPLGKLDARQISLKAIIDILTDKIA